MCNEHVPKLGDMLIAHLFQTSIKPVEDEVQELPNSLTRAQADQTQAWHASRSIWLFCQKSQTLPRGEVTCNTRDSRVLQVPQAIVGTKCTASEVIINNQESHRSCGGSFDCLCSGHLATWQRASDTERCRKPVQERDKPLRR